MNRTEEVLLALSAAQQARLVALWQQVEDGILALAEFVVAAVNVLVAGNATGYALGVNTVRAQIETGVGVPTITDLAAGAHHLDADRLTEAVQTVLDAEHLDTRMQLQRIADNEPKEAAARGASDLIASSPHVTGWTRGLDGDACELCVWWWREGRVFQPDHAMPRHTGCTCEPVPTLAVGDNVQTPEQARNAARSRDRRTKESAA